METLAIITGGFLPVPAIKGGAVENLIQNFLDENEKYKKYKIIVFSDFDKNAVVQMKNYQYSSGIYVKTNCFVNILDKITFFIAKNILHKENSHSYRFIFKRLYFLNKVSIYLKKNNYEKVILENHPTEYLALKWRKNYIKYKDRYYYHCHNEFPSMYGCKDIIEDTKNIICVSECIKNKVKDKNQLTKTNFSVLRNAIDIDKFDKEINDEEKEKIRKKYNIKKDEKILLFTGRIVPEKGIKELIQSLKKVCYENYKLLIVGAALNESNTKTAFEEEMQKEIDEIKNKVVFTGFVDYNEIYKYYKIADIAVLPSIWDDPAPLTIIESMSCGLPIISTVSGGIPEYTSKECAILIKRDNHLIENLSLNIDYLLNDKEKREQMSKASLKKSKEFTLEKYFNGFIKELE